MYSLFAAFLFDGGDGGKDQRKGRKGNDDEGEVKRFGMCHGKLP